jgi:arginyl-tRNA synthetase
MDVVAELRDGLARALRGFAARGLLDRDPDLSRLAVEPCRDVARGDLVSNAALAFGPAWSGPGSGQGGRRLAEALAGEIAREAGIADVAVAGTGFLNVTLATRHLADAAAGVLAGDPVPALARPGAVVLVSLAATGPGHRDAASLDHLRAAVVADALGRLLAGTGHGVAVRFEHGTAWDRQVLARLGTGVSWASPGLEQPGREAAAERIVVRPGRAGGVSGAAAARVVPVAPCRLVARPGIPASADDLDAGLAEALRFAILCRERSSSLDLDPGAAADRSHAGPSFDVAYAHARAARALRGASATEADRLSWRDALSRPGLLGPGDRDLLRPLALFPHAVARSVAEHEPQRVSALLRDVSGAVHRQWNTSKDQPQLRFLNEEQRDLTKARLGLMMASAIVLKSGLRLFGITAPDEMR